MSIFIFIVFALHAGFAVANERGMVRDKNTETAPIEDELKIAIVVGIDEYDHVGDLNYAQADAEAMAELFRSQGYLVETILGFEAYGNRIVERIRGYKKFLENEDGEAQGSIVFTFSGHGFNNEKENFLATPDTDRNNLEETAIPMSAITQALQELNVKKRILFIDACRNNPTDSSRSADDTSGTFLDDESEAEGLAIMYSTAKGSLSWEDSNLGKGVFTHYLLEGLRGAAAGDIGFVSFDGLHKYVANRVNRHVFEVFRDVQKPYRGGEWSGEFILARYESSNSPAPFVPNITPLIVSPPIEPGFNFLLAAADLQTVRELFCKEDNKAEGQALKKEASWAFKGEFKYRDKQDEQLGWELYMKSMRYCSTAALMDISKTLAKRNRCDIAIEYARLAVDNGNRSATRWVKQLEERMDGCVG